MQLKKTVILISAFYSGALLAAQPSMNVEEKLAQLEAQIQELKQQQAAATQAAPAVVVQSEEPVSKTAPPKLTLSGFGDIKFYGDVEFNMDAASKTGSLTSVKQSANSDWAPGDKERWDINGRILLGFDGYRKMDNGNFAGFSVQPLGEMNFGLAFAATENLEIGVAARNLLDQHTYWATVGKSERYISNDRNGGYMNTGRVFQFSLTMKM